MELDDLTPRQQQIFWFILEGLHNKHIAQKLKLSEFTISSYRTKMMQRLGLHNDARLAFWAMQKGLARLNARGQVIFDKRGKSK